MYTYLLIYLLAVADADDVNMIEHALIRWQTNTCIQFKRVDYNLKMSKQHILFTSEVG